MTPTRRSIGSIAIAVGSLLITTNTLHAAIVPIEEGHDYVQVKKPLTALRHRTTSTGSFNSNVTTSTQRYLGEDFEDTIVEASSSTSQLSPTGGNHHRELADYRTALVFRLVGPMGSPSVTIDQLWGAIFSNGNSLKHQLARCSAGALQLNPTNWGVQDLYINAYQNTNQGELAQMAEAAAIQAVGGGYSNIREVANHVIFVMPNRGNNFVGSAEVCPPGVSGTSFFGDTYALSLSVLMHEIAHNLNMRHASKDGNSYGDTSGMMGISSGQTDGNPLQCYNACNHWMLNWFTSNRLDMSGGVGAPQIIHVAAFVDADQVIPGQYALVKLPGSIYLQYNRAKEHNVGTRDKIDQLAIVWDSSGSGQGDTVMITGLDMYNPSYNSGSAVVQVCSVQIGGAVDYMVVSIGAWTDCNAGVSNAQAVTQPQQQSPPSTTNTNTRGGGWKSWNGKTSSATVEESEPSSSSSSSTTTTTAANSNTAWEPNGWK